VAAAAVALTIAVSCVALLSAQLGPSDLLGVPQTVSFRYTWRCVEGCYAASLTLV
jgi:hypothetical protein